MGAAADPMGMRIMDLTRDSDGAELTVELLDGDASAKVHVETRPAGVCVKDAADRTIEVDIEEMLHRGIEVGEELDLDDSEDVE